MADAYRGLTIRIGGDTTELQKALRSTNSAISQTQTQLRKMTQALNMDPGNLDAIETNVALIGQKAVETASRLNQLKSALQQVSNQKVELFSGETTKTVQQLADETEDAALRATQAKEAYALLDDQLASLYQPINKAVQEAQNLDEPIDEADVALKEFADEWEALHGKKFAVTDLVKEYKLDGAIDKLNELGLLTDDVEAQIRELQPQWQAAFDENEVAKAVNGLEDLRVEITRSEAEVNSLTQRFSELSRQSTLSDFGQGLDDRLKSIDAAAEQATDSLTRASAALDMDPTNVDAAEQKMRALADSAELSQMRLETMQEKLARMDAAGVGDAANETRNVALRAQEAADAYDEATEAVVRCKGVIAELESQQNKMAARGNLGEEYDELTASIEEARGELARLEAAQQSAKAEFDTAKQVQEYDELKTSIAETSSELTRLNGEMSGANGTFSQVSGSLMGLGLSLSTSVTPALMSLGSYAIESASDMDSAYRDMRKTVSATEEQFVALRDAAVEFSMTNVTSADQILSIQAIGGELGVATEDLETFAEVVSNLDIATNIDAEDAAEDLGQLSNILSDLNGDTMPNFADALVRLGNNGASTESQIADIASRIGSMASIVGMSTPEILAWSSTIASTGQGAEAAGTAISNTISDIENAVANGGDALEGFAEVAGMSAEEFTEAWENDPSSALQAFIEGLNEVEENGGSAVATLSDLGITGSRQTQAIQGLMQMIGGLNDNLEMSDNAWNGVSDQWGEAGDAAREAEAKAEGFSGSMSILQNTAQALAAEFGEALTPVIQFLSDALQGAYDVIDGLPDGFKQVTVAVGGLAAALGPAILLFKSVGDFVGDVKKVSSAMKTAQAATKGLGSAASSLSGTISGTGGLVSGLGGLGVALGALAIGAVVSGIMSFVSEMEQAKEEAAALEKATDGLVAAAGNIDGAYEEAGDSFETLRTNIDDLGESIDAQIESAGNLADEWDELNTSTAGQITQLQNAGVTFGELAEKGDLTADEVSRLKAAVATLNDQLGTNYEVVRSNDGTYQVLADGVKVAKDEVYELIDAQVQQMKIQANLSELQDAYENQAEAAANYAEALGLLRDAQEQYNKATEEFNQFVSENGGNEWDAYYADPEKYNELSGAVTKTNEALSDAQEKFDKASESMEGADEAVEKLTTQQEELTKAVDGTYEGLQALVSNSVGIQNVFGDDTDLLADFADDLEDAGVSVGEFSTLTEKQMTELADTWMRSGGDMEQVLDELAGYTSEATTDVREALMGMGDGEVAAALEGSGVNLDAFSQAMVDAGISAQDLKEIGTKNFTALAARCGGNIDLLIWMLQNYNGTPIYDKEGNITVDQALLLDSQNRVYVWNGSELKTLDGRAVVAYESLKLANDEAYEWDNEGNLVDKRGNAVADYTEVHLANGEMAIWTGTELQTQNGEVLIEQQELHDCLGNMVEYKNTKLNPIEGEVYCDYDELSAALGKISDLRRQSGYTATVYLNTVRTTTYRTVGSPSSSSARSARSAYAARDLPASPMATALAATPTALASTADAAMRSAATILAMKSGDVSQEVSQTAIDSVSVDRIAKAIAAKISEGQGTVGTVITQNFRTRVVRSDEDLYSAAPIIYRNAIREARNATR